MEHWLRGALWALLLLCVSATAGAEGQGDEERARTFFERGLERYDRGDYQGAVVEFERAYAARPFPIILFNIGLAHEKAGKPVEAIAAMRKLLAQPGKLKEDRLERARQTVSEQKKLVAELEIACNVPGAVVRVDGRSVGGATPLGAPVEVAGGRLIVEASAEGYEMAREVVQAGGGSTVQVTLELIEAKRAFGQVEVKSLLPDAELWVDGKLVAVTPLAATVPLAPDKPHLLELRRDGYLPATHTLTLSEGQLSKIRLEPEEDREAITAAGAKLKLELAQPEVSIYIDGKRREIGTSAVSVAPGLHVVRAERDGYEPLTQRVRVTAGDTTFVDVDLPPTADTRAQLIGDAELVQGLGIGFVAVGVAAVAVGAGVFVWSGNRKQEFDEEAARRDAFEGEFAVCDDSTDAPAWCGPEVARIAGDRDNAANTQIGAAVGIGVGAAATVTGIVLLVTGDRPSSFRPFVDEAEFGSVRIEPVFSAGPEGGFVGVAGSF